MDRAVSKELGFAKGTGTGGVFKGCGWNLANPVCLHLIAAHRGTCIRVTRISSRLSLKFPPGHAGGPKRNRAKDITKEKEKTQ